MLYGVRLRGQVMARAFIVQGVPCSWTPNLKDAESIRSIWPGSEVVQSDGATIRAVTLPGCEYPYCGKPIARDNVCSEHINTNTHRRRLGLDLLWREASGVRGTFRVEMNSPCSYWSDGMHIIPKTGICRCGRRDPTAEPRYHVWAVKLAELNERQIRVFAGHARRSERVSLLLEQPQEEDVRGLDADAYLATADRH